MPATRELLALQSMDGELAVRRARLTEIAPLLGDDSALRALASRLASEQAEVDSALSRQQEFDAVIACYHDQGLVPIKLIAFGQAVNVTLGLPIVRTSVDHGTGFDIAGRGIADPSGMIAAVRLAARLCA